MKKKDYILFASDLFLYHGGVCDYTDNFASQLSLKGKLRYVVTPHGKNESELYEVKKFDIPFSRSGSGLDSLTLLSKLRTLVYYSKLYWRVIWQLRKLKVDRENTVIIFPEYYVDRFDVIIHCARLLKIPYAIIFHGLDLIWAGDKRFKQFKGNFSGARFIIFNSIATQELCRRLFPDIYPDKNIVIHPGVDVSKIENTKLEETDPFRSDPETIIFSTVSRLAYRKGIDIAVRIVNELAKRNYKIKYYIGGVGDEKERLEALVRQLNAEDHIQFLGSVNNKEKYRLLRDSDFFLLPNHSAGNSDFEGFGISFIEASLFGNVVIGGNHGGAKEAVSDQRTGFLFDFDKNSSIGEAVAAIVDCIGNRASMDRIKMNGIDFVRSNYDWEMLTRRFLEWDN